ncbi:MAG: hypothetical protein ACOH1J_05435 [Microbacteriaceae bacterium]
MSTRWARFARGWVTASFSVLVAALSHVAAGGSAPGLFGVVVALAFGGMLSVLLAGRTLSRVRLAVSVAVSQAIFHLLFTSPVTSAVANSGSTHNHGATLAPFTVDAPTAAAHTSHTDGAMWLAHALAAVLTLLALRYGETAFWGLVELAASGLRAVFVGVAAPAVPTRSSLRFIAVAYRRAHTTLADYLARRHYRGPPRATLVAASAFSL